MSKKVDKAASLRGSPSGACPPQIALFATSEADLKRFREFWQDNKRLINKMHNIEPKSSLIITARLAWEEALRGPPKSANGELSDL